LDIQEDDDACYVVDGRVFFLPPLHGLADQGLCGLFSTVVLVMRQDYVHCLVVGNEFPDAVGGENHKLISFYEIHLCDFWYGIHSDFSSSCIAETPSQCEARYVLMEMPHPGRSQWIALHVSVSCHSSTGVEDSRLLVGLVCLVISVQRNAHHLELAGLPARCDFFSSCQGGSGVSDVGTEHFVANDEHTYASRSRESQVDA